MPRRLSRASVVRVVRPRWSVSSTGQSSHILIRCSMRRSTIRRATDFRLLAREGRNVVVTRGSTYENRANLAPGFFDQIIRKYEGTRLGRQELNAELLEDTPGALWSHAIIDAARQAAAPNLARIVVAIDPAAEHG